MTSRRRRAVRIVRLPGGRLVGQLDIPPHGPPPTRTGTRSSPRSESAAKTNARFRSLDWDWREPVGTAGTKMASTSSTRTAGSTWAATRTGSRRRSHLEWRRSDGLPVKNPLVVCSVAEPMLGYRKQVFCSGMEPGTQTFVWRRCGKTGSFLGHGTLWLCMTDLDKCFGET